MLLPFTVVVYELLGLGSILRRVVLLTDGFSPCPANQADRSLDYEMKAERQGWGLKWKAWTLDERLSSHLCGQV